MLNGFLGWDMGNCWADVLTGDGKSFSIDSVENTQGG